MRKSFTVSMIAFIFITLGCGGGGQAGSAASPFSISVSTAFTAGISHIDGKYRFTQNNYLFEGAHKISALGSGSIFIYLTIALPRSRRPSLGPDPHDRVPEML